MMSRFRVAACAAAIAAAALATAGCGGSANAVDAPPVTLGVTTDNPADPAIVTTIDQVESDFTTMSGESYSYYLHYWDSSRAKTKCGLVNARIVVEGGVVTDAVGLPNGRYAGCRIDPSEVPTIAEIFDLARSVAGASEFAIETGPANATVVSVSATDSDLSMEFTISNLNKSTAHASVGYDEVSAASSAARTRWEAQSFDYTLRIASPDLPFGEADRETTVIDGKPVQSADGNADQGAAIAGWPPSTVDDLFRIIDGYASFGHAVAVFDPNTGLPTNLWLDPSPETTGDELTLVASVERL